MEGSRAAALAAHSAAGLSAAAKAEMHVHGQRLHLAEAVRLLRLAESCARSAVALLDASVQQSSTAKVAAREGAQTDKKTPRGGGDAPPRAPESAPAGSAKRRRRRRRPKAKARGNGTEAMDVSNESGEKKVERPPEISAAAPASWTRTSFSALSAPAASAPSPTVFPAGSSVTLHDSARPDLVGVKCTVLRWEPDKLVYVVLTFAGEEIEVKPVYLRKPQFGAEPSRKHRGG